MVKVLAEEAHLGKDHQRLQFLRQLKDVSGVGEDGVHPVPFRLARTHAFAHRRSHASSASLASHDRDALGGVDFAASIRAAMASAAWKREVQPWEARKRALKPACPGGNGGFGAHLSSRQPSREPLEPPRVMDRATRTSRGTSRPPSRHASPEGTRPNRMRSSLDSWSKKVDKSVTW